MNVFLLIDPEFPQCTLFQLDYHVYDASYMICVFIRSSRPHEGFRASRYEFKLSTPFCPQDKINGMYISP